MNSFVPLVFEAWIPAAVILFLAIGPRRASLITIFAGFLLLPRAPISLGIFTVNKGTVGGLALLAGILVSDPKTLLRARPRLVDLPMIAFVLLPLVSLAANGFADAKISYDQVFRKFSEWALPYLVGRLYFGDRDGPRRVAVAVVVAGLCSVPIYAFEMLAGPRWYLAGLVYGIPYYQNMVSRLGGWRPEGFQYHGIEASTWLALSTTVAAWLWLRDAQIWPKLPGWLPALALLLVTIACRGVYGYLHLAIGLLTALTMHFFRTRAMLIVLALIPPTYVASRASGLWDGQAMVRWTEKTGRSGTISYRLMAEDSYDKTVWDHGVVFGFGGSDRGLWDWGSQVYLWADGWWVHEFRTGGMLGLSAFFLALFLFPAALGMALPTGRPGVSSPGSMAWGLTVFLLLHSLDSVHNLDSLTATSLIGGTLVGLFLHRQSSRPELEYLIDLGPRRPDTPGLRPAIATILILLTLEILGRMPRDSTGSIPDPHRPELPATKPMSPTTNTP